MIVKYPDSQIYEEAPELRPASEAPVIAEVRAQVEARVEAHEAQVDITTVEKTILGSCKDRPKTGQEILAASGYSTRTGNFKRSLEKMLSLGFIEMTIPDKPWSSKQKYRLTDAALVAMTLMIAESRPEEKDVLVRIVMHLLCEKSRI
ncbi:MAG: hypothetical protein ISR61_02190 [Desulfobacteraceae bacterium]|uniref:Filamentation induced by cAMP protein Fic-like C-terminal domain-containing protein n=1 Tax=Candidatus Desulfacyla euxinica TaxID=2841693 RepID=A0A8J6N002_9DELT|nr:hypothetical protein [Candidatus Desulfacyla euxinica]MBL6977727.1 hypothetical protein [Desulfobacteraceae bacterium]